jgi:demethylmenaquinone methyltransferase/2-methoxy-6-polyprenyl-1,4-benzoquinol methylase
MFGRVPRRYDLINAAVSWGLDRRWRAAAARECLAAEPRRVLDLGCGTGDLVLDIAGRAGETVDLVGLDFSHPMLERARAKGETRGSRVTWLLGDASALPFADSSFDRVGVSFAFRNLTWANPHAAAHLAEILRVLRPEGRLVVVESAQPARQPIRALYHLYMRGFVAGLGGALSGERAAYRYLGESAARFHGPPEVERMLLDAGFATVRVRTMLFGAVGLYVACKAR